MISLPPEPLEIQLLNRLRQSPFGRALNSADYRISLKSDKKAWILRGREGLPGVMAPTQESPWDAEITCQDADLRRMLAGQVPETGVRLNLGSRLSPRRAQAHGLLIAAALNWAGPWPDITADPQQHALLRTALLDVRFGIEDHRYRLFPIEAPLQAEVRHRVAVAGDTLVTDGFSDQADQPEFAIQLPPRTPITVGLRHLRAAALAWAEGFRQGIPPLTFRIEPLILARWPSQLVFVEGAPWIPPPTDA